jgi:hypothetical protein
MEEDGSMAGELGTAGDFYAKPGSKESLDLEPHP